MKEITVKVYQYSELNEKAKEKAVNWFLDGQDFEFEWDCIQDDAKNIGIELTAWDYRGYCNGELLISAEDVIKKIIVEHGENCETYKTAKKYEHKFKDNLNDDEFVELEIEFLKDILEDYRVIADNQYEYVQSEEYISECMEANEYDFLEDGTRF
jgi:hypothetical protein